MMERPRQKANTLNLKLLILLMVMVLTFGSVIGGTVAWLIAKPAPVVNTFTYGDINIELGETDIDGDGNPTINEYKMLPGIEITKDPTVTVKADSEDMWLFVKLEKSANFDLFMTYAIADGWTELETGVYYREVTGVSADTDFTVLKDDKVIVSEEVTKEQLNNLDKEGASNYPKLTITAYAVQRTGIDDVADAWAKAEATENTSGGEGEGSKN